MPWTSGPNSVPSTTASPSGAGTTSGSPTLKWMVSWLDQEWTGSVHSCGTFIFYVWFAARILRMCFSCSRPWELKNIYRLFCGAICKFCFCRGSHEELFIYQSCRNTVSSASNLNHLFANNWHWWWKTTPVLTLLSMTSFLLLKSARQHDTHTR